MPDENPEMTYPSPKPRKPAARRRTPVKKSPPTPPAATPVSDPRVNEYLTNIYKDKNGKLPDMRHIAIKKSGGFLKSLTSFVITAAILVGVGWFGYFWLSGHSQNTKHEATVAISGPTSVMLGTTSTYTVTVQNTSDVAIPKATVQLFYPDGFVYSDSSLPSRNVGHNEWDLGSVSAHAKKVFTISGAHYGAVGSTGSWRAFLSYQPENFNTTLQESTALSTSIDSSPFELSVAGPATIIPGTDVQFTFTLKSTGSWQPAKMYITPTLPANFVITTTTPLIDNTNKRWVVMTQNVTSTSALRTFVLRGMIPSAVDDSVAIKATVTLPLGATGQLYELAHTAITPKIAKNGVAFSVAVNGSVNDTYTHPGDTLAVTLLAKNTGLAEAKKATIKLSFDAPSIKNQSMLAWGDLVDKNDGDVKGQQVSPSVRRGTITWTSSAITGLTKLKSGDEVQIDVSLPIKGGKDFDLSLLSPSSSIKLTSEIDYTDASGTAKVVAGNPITLSFNSDTSLDVHDTVDGNTHAITWIINNSLHTLRDIQVTAQLYGAITYAASSTPDGGSLTYNDSDKTLTWRVEAMPDSVDVLSAPFTIMLNKIDKSQNILIGKVHLTATDAVTGQPIDLTQDEISLK